MKNPREARLLVVGAGAIGGTLAGTLAKAGHRIELLCKHPGLAGAIASSGLRVRGMGRDFAAVLPAYPDASGCSGTYDYVFLATKATDMEEAARSVLPFLGPDSRVVSLQNGICEEAIGRIVGAERTIGCVVGYGATMVEPGVLELTSDGEFVIGYLDARADSHLETVAAILSELVPARISANMLGDLYSKLLINSCVTTLGAVCGLTLGSMLIRKRARDLFIAVMAEGMAVADAMKARVEPYAGKLDYYRFFRWSALQRHLFILAFGLKYRKLKSSSLQSLERGRPTEIDYLNGYICRKGTEFGVPAPVNDALVALVKAIERGERRIGPRNFRELPRT
jgi:2-dehydropantoate 2-reductase